MHATTAKDAFTSINNPSSRNDGYYCQPVRETHSELVTSISIETLVYIINAEIYTFNKQHSVSIGGYEQYVDLAIFY